MGCLKLLCCGVFKKFSICASRRRYRTNCALCTLKRHWMRPIQNLLVQRIRLNAGIAEMWPYSFCHTMNTTFALERKPHQETSYKGTTPGVLIMVIMMFQR